MHPAFGLPGLVHDTDDGPVATGSVIPERPDASAPRRCPTPDAGKSEFSPHPAFLNQFCEGNPMTCFECNSSAMLINQIVPWVSVGILVASVLVFWRLLKPEPGIWTFLVVAMVLMEEVFVSLWLFCGDVPLLSPYVMGGM